MTAKLVQNSPVPTIWPKKIFPGYLSTRSAPTGSATRRKKQAQKLPLKLSLEVLTKEPIKVPPGRLSGSSKRNKKNTSLDSNVNFTSRPVNASISKGSFDFYKLRDEAAKVLPFLGISKCGKVPYRKHVTIDKNEKDVKRYGNINHCGSVWTCPVCAYKKTKIRQEQLREIIKLHNNSDCSFYFLTLTIPHNIKQPLAVLLHNLKTAWKEITGDRATKEIFKIANYIQTLEIRFSFVTGFSPHLHAIFMTTEKEKIKPLFDLIIESWTKKVKGKIAAQKIIEVTDIFDMDEYLAKLSLADELTGGQTKDSKKGKSVSYFDMLKDTVKYKKQIEEYGYATKGTQTLHKSKGLNITKDKDQDKDQVKENLLNIHKVVYKLTIVKKCDYKKVLDIADDWNQVADYFKSYNIDQSEKMINPRMLNSKDEIINAKIITGKKPKQFHRKLYDKMTGKPTIGRPAKRKNSEPIKTIFPTRIKTKKPGAITLGDPVTR